jgi:formate-dependent nitrite reductase membrane component NrfD
MSLGFILLAIAILAGLAAWIWLITVAFKNQEKGWGIALIVSLFLPISPIVGLVFLVLKWGIARRPGILYLASLAVCVDQSSSSASAKQMIRNVGQQPLRGASR